MEGKVRRITQKQIESGGVDAEDVLYVKHGKKWVAEPATVVSEEYIESRKGVDENKKMQLFAAKSLIMNGFKDLTNRERDVIMSYIEGNTQQMIADQLGISRGSVVQYIKRARKKLKKLVPEFMEESNET